MSLNSHRHNPCELEIDLFCSGVRIDPSCTLVEDARKVSRTRPGWAPVSKSSFRAIARTFDERAGRGGLRPALSLSPPEDGAEYLIQDERTGWLYSVRIPVEPAWYSKRTTKGTEMAAWGAPGHLPRIYISNSCLYWYSDPSQNCRFCTTGSNVA